MLNSNLTRASIPQSRLFYCGATQRTLAQQGFTLVELAVVIAVMGILLAIAAPNFRNTIFITQIQNASFDLFSSINEARNTAITRNTEVTITPASGSNWASGWTITDAAANVLKTQNAFPKITMTGPTSLTYNSAGRLNTPPALCAPSNRPCISLSAPNLDAVYSRCITVDLSGRPITAKGAC